MFKHLLACSLISLSAVAGAQPVVVPNELIGTKEANAVLKEKCVPACLVLDEQDWAQLKAQIEELIKARVKQQLKGSV